MWILVALSAISIHVGIETRTLRGAAVNALETTPAKLAAIAGVHTALARIHAAARDDGFVRGTHVPGSGPANNAFSFLISGHMVEVRLTDLTQRLNINNATERQLALFLASSGVDTRDASRMAQTIADWRDSDAVPRADGAEDEYYVPRGLSRLPSNGPIVTMAEVEHIRGMTKEVVDLLTEAATLWGSGRVNLSTARPTVLLTVPGITAEAVEVLLADRGPQRQLYSLDQLAVRLSDPARTALHDHFDDALDATTWVADEWLIESVAIRDGRTRWIASGVVSLRSSRASLYWLRA